MSPSSPVLTTLRTFPRLSSDTDDLPFSPLVPQIDAQSVPQTRTLLQTGLDETCTISYPFKSHPSSAHPANVVKRDRVYMLDTERSIYKV